MDIDLPEPPLDSITAIIFDASDLGRIMLFLKNKKLTGGQKYMISDMLREARDSGQIAIAIDLDLNVYRLKNRHWVKYDWTS